MQLIKRIFRRTISRDLIIVMISIVTFLSFIIISILYDFNVRLKNKEFKIKAKEITLNLAATLGTPIWNLDKKEINKVTNLYMQYPNIINIEITFVLFGVDDPKIFSLKKELTTDENTKLYTLENDIYFRDKKIAVLKIDFIKNFFISEVKEIYKEFFIIVVILLILISIVVKISLKIFLDKPFEELLNNMSKIINGEYGERMLAVKQHNMNVVINKFNAMSKVLASRTKEIGMANEHIDNIIKSLPVALFIMNKDKRITFLNKPALKFIGMREEDIIGKYLITKVPFFELYEQNFDKITKISDVISLSHEKVGNEEKKYYDMIFFALSDEGLLDGYGLLLDDVTQIEINDMKLRQSQKMEMIGNLAGGIAHDFNNVLGGIIGNLSLIRYKLNKKDDMNLCLSQYLDTMENAGDRAKDIVAQLMSLSRRNETEFENIDLNDSIRNVVKICTVSFDKSIEISTSLFPTGAIVKGNLTQIDQVLLNICINSAHAMTIMKEPGERLGGDLAINITSIYADRFFCTAHPQAIEGEYYLISVKDTGVGIPKSIIDKIFDPFYTSKNEGVGTGLGLSMVYNIVKNHKGFLNVYSAYGKGTVFNIYYPVSYFSKEDTLVKKSDELVFKGTGLILIIDDEPMICKLAKNILEECGYTVLIANNGKAGIELFKQFKNELKCVVIDIIMPKQSGEEVAEDIIKIDENVKIIYASGFKFENLEKKWKYRFIQKPFTMKQLSKVLHEVIG